MLEKFRELAWYSQLLIAVLAAALLVVGAEYLYLQEKSSATAELRTKLNGLEQEIKIAEAVRARHRQYRAEFDRLQAQFKSYQAILPFDKEEDAFIRSLQETAASVNVHIRRIAAKAVLKREVEAPGAIPETSTGTGDKKKDEQPREFYSEIPFTMEVAGTYHSLATFFDRISRFARIVNVTDFDIASTANPGKAKAKSTFAFAPHETIVATCVVATYFQIEGDVER